MIRVEFSGSVVYRLGGLQEVDIGGETLIQVLRNLEDRFPVLEGTFLKKGKVNSLYFMYLNGRDIRMAGETDSPIPDGSVLRIMNALTGG